MYENHYTASYELDGEPVVIAYSGDVHDTTATDYITALRAAKRTARQVGKPVTIFCAHKLSNGKWYTTTRTITPET